MLEFAKNYFKNYLALKFFGPGAVKYPLLVSYYVTHRCNLKCTYCSDGFGTAFYDRLRNELNLEQVAELFQKIIPSTQVLDITGGEPLMREDILEIILVARNAGFRNIFLNTNGLFLDQYPEVIETVDALYVSLDSLDVDTLSHIYRTGTKNIKRILNNIERLAQHNHESRVVVSAVLLPENLGHIPALMEYCVKKGFQFVVSPALEGKNVDMNLQSSAEYQRCIDKILDYKNNGLTVIGSEEYFEIIRHCSRYTCYPMLMPTIDPEGKLYLPCLEIAETMRSLFEYQDLRQLIQSLQKNQRTSEYCRNVCHIFCHAGISTMLEDPIASVSEVWRIKDRLVRTKRAGAILSP